MACNFLQSKALNLNISLKINDSSKKYGSFGKVAKN
jgi:hypothetical protein